MKLHELKIRNIRGIRKLDLALNGESTVVYGYNGTGKSAVVDAIDFLLTGDIQRLTGRRGVSLRDHGPHISTSAREAFVEATVQLPEGDDLIVLRRSFAQATQLTCPADARPAIERLVAVAAQRHHILTRSGVLAFITAAPKTRAELIQTILNLEQVEDIRQSMVAAVNSARQAHKTKRASRLAAEGQLATSLALSGFDLGASLAAVNKYRQLLGSTPVDSIGLAKRDVLPPQVTAAIAAAASLLADVQIVGKATAPEQQASIDSVDSTLRSHLATLRANAADMEAALRIDFLERALLLVENAVSCPVCDTTWPLNHLKDLVEAKLQRARTLLAPLQAVREATDYIVRWIGGQVGALERLTTVASGRLPQPAIESMRRYATALNAVKAELTDPLKMPTLPHGDPPSLSLRLELPAIYEQLRGLYRTLSEQTQTDPRQAAWDCLTRAAENWQTLMFAVSAEDTSRRLAQDADLLRDVFIRARDEVLTEIYNSVRDRFVDLYRQVHAPDEAGFDATIRPTDTGLELEVDFYGLRRVAPFALHSDGHQDSMGLCLFLALSERVDAATLGFRVLDDVVMSVDIGHRRGIARLLAQLNAQVQFIITTHDQVWVKQLQTEGCVRRRNCTRFLGWSLGAGPLTRYDANFLDDSREALSRNNVPEAAASLRRELEQFFQFAADSLCAKVPFSLTGQYDMGQVSTSCFARLRELTKKAKDSAGSWNNAEALTELTLVEGSQAAALSAANAEQWAINANVHFNQWMDMPETEFRSVLDGFARVCDLFRCAECDGLLAVSTDGFDESTLQCPCAKVAWNLKRRDR